MNTDRAPRIVSTETVTTVDGIVVRPHWSGVDRPEGVGYQCKDAKIAARLVRAMEAGAVFVNPTVGTDVNGRTYVSARSTVLGRMMNADLQRLGF